MVEKQTVSPEMERLIRRYLDPAGRVREFPARTERRLAVLRYLASKFDGREAYSEGEVNEILARWHTFDDYFLLRRELVDHRLLCRTANGARYWKPEEKPAGTEAEPDKSL
ncbi:DUF2087 domain-containing protein [Papillibacter cinnamivorans]|uniref:DUF2087 domain-containing protein n=1 Tax=Papillibacter cinnamivorans TaxID=100176 RepID=UPI001FA82BB5|nr:DUF2087 domain-containing protein [Papillibacter cinnamivorans]